MLRYYVRAANWWATRTAANRADDRGAVSVETAILVGALALVAVGVGTGLTILVNRKMAEWSGL
jgi:Flp pilus assembly pilin Flp